jgi:hypothetical protein
MGAMNLASLQRLESQLCNVEGLLNQRELCARSHRQLRNNLRSALETVATERVRAESQAARRMIREYLATNGGLETMVRTVEAEVAAA